MQVAEDANELTLVLATESELSPPVGQAVVERVSLLMERQVVSSGSSSSEAAAESILAAADELARAVASWIATAGAINTTIEPIVLASPNLNMTLGVGLPAALTATPITCESGAGNVASVDLPSSVFDGVDGFDATSPVVGVLWTSPVNLHAVPGHSSNGSATATVNRLAQATAGHMSHAVTFILVQNGAVLPVRNVTPPINISLPYTVNVTDTDHLPCIGPPVDAEAAAACENTVECQYWATTSDHWATEGCETILDASGTVVCSCTHLTEFIAFEFPTSGDELLATALLSVSMNSLSEEAWACATDPSRSWRSVPTIWGIVCFLFFMFIALLGNAITRDRHEISKILALLAGKKIVRTESSRLLRLPSSRVLPATSKRDLLSQANKAEVRSESPFLDGWMAKHPGKYPGRGLPASDQLAASTATATSRTSTLASPPASPPEFEIEETAVEEFFEEDGGSEVEDNEDNAFEDTASQEEPAQDADDDAGDDAGDDVGDDAQGYAQGHAQGHARALRRVGAAGCGHLRAARARALARHRRPSLQSIPDRLLVGW